MWLIALTRIPLARMHAKTVPESLGNVFFEFGRYWIK